MSQAPAPGRPQGQDNSDMYILRSEQYFHKNFDS